MKLTSGAIEVSSACDIGSAAHGDVGAYSSFGTRVTTGGQATTNSSEAIATASGGRGSSKGNCHTGGDGGDHEEESHVDEKQWGWITLS